MNKIINSSLIALAIVALLSYTMAGAVHAQNATGVTRDHDREHFFGPGLGIGARLNLGLPLFREHNHVAATIAASTPAVTAPVVVRDHNRDFARFHDFAFAHRDHFIFLHNQYVLLPQTVGCPEGSQLNIATGECVVIQPTIIEQAAPTILSESVATPPSVVEQQQTVVQSQTNVVAPNVSCPAGSTLQPDNTCQVTTTSTQTVPAIVTCPVGTSLQNNQCVEVQQQIVVAPLPCPSCPPGSDLVNGQCIVNALPSAVTVGTAPGEIIVLGHHFHHEGDLPFLR